MLPLLPKQSKSGLDEWSMNNSIPWPNRLYKWMSKFLFWADSIEIHVHDQSLPKIRAFVIVHAEQLFMLQKCACVGGGGVGALSGTMAKRTAMTATMTTAGRLMKALAFSRAGWKKKTQNIWLTFVGSGYGNTPCTEFALDDDVLHP